MKKDYDCDGVMHMDTSSKLYERKDTGIAYKIIKTNHHQGLGLSLKLKKELERDLGYDYARIYSICIYYLIEKNLDIFDTLVICEDEDYNKVEKYLRLLFSDNRKYKEKEVISLYKLREITGNRKLKSYADNVANSYRKRALKNIQRQQVGTPLNIIKISYKLIKDKWNEIEKKLCVSGG